MNISVKLAIALCFLLGVPNAVAARTLKTDTSDRLGYKLADLGVESAVSDNREQGAQLFNRALELAYSIDNLEKRHRTVIAIAAKMGAVKDKERVLKVLEKAVADALLLNDRASSDEVAISPDTGYLALADIALEMAKLGATKRTDKSALALSREIFNRAVKLERAQAKKADRTEDNYYRDAGLVKIIARMAEAGQLQEAERLSRTLPSALSRAEALNDVASRAIAEGKIDFARRTLDRVLQAVSRIENGTYAYMSNGDCSNYKFSLLGAVAKNLNLLGELEQVLEIANSVYGCASATGESSQSYQFWVYTGILNSFSKPEQVKQTWNSARQITDTLDKLDIWGAIAVKLVEAGEIDLSFEAARKYAAAEVSEVVRYYFSPDSYKHKELTNIAFKLAEAGATARARQVMALIEQPLSKEIEVLLGIPAAKKLDREGKSTEARELLSRNLQLLDLNKLDSPNLRSNEVLKSIEVRQKIAIELAKIGQLEFALRVVQGIPQGRGWNLQQMAAALVDMEDVEGAFQVSQLIDDSIALIEILETIAPKLKTKERVETALKIVERIEADAKIGSSWKEKAIANIAPRLIATGQVDRGLELGEKIKSDEVRSSFALEIAKLGKHQEAIAILESLPDDNAYKYEAIADLAVLLTK